MPHKSGHALVSQNKEAVSGNARPPSTIAAKIVQNHEQATAGRHFQDHGLFEQLLQEILSHSDSEYLDTRTLHKLVTIVIKGGLRILAQNDPFISRDVVLTQAATSIRVIELTIRKNPEIILESSLSDTDDGFRLPLIFLIFSSIITILNHENIEILLPLVKRLLFCCISEILVTADLWHRTSALVEFYRSSIRCM